MTARKCEKSAGCDVNRVIVGMRADVDMLLRAQSVLVERLRAIEEKLATPSEEKRASWFGWSR